MLAPPLTAALRLALCVLALGVALRACLLWILPASAFLEVDAARQAAGVEGLWPWPVTVMARGTLLDAPVAALFAGLFWLCLRVPSTAAQRVAATLLAAVVLLVTLAEGFFWNEFQSRLDRLVFHYLAYPREVLSFLEDQFYLSLYVIPFLLLAALLGHFFLIPLRARPENRAARSQVRRPIAIGLIAAAIAVLASASLPPGRIPEQLASNGYAGILAAALTDVGQFDGAYGSVSEAAGIPAVPKHSAELTARSGSTPPRHVLMIIMESFAGAVWQEPTLRRRYLPAFEALSRESLEFTNLFASGSRTTRGMEALLNGMMPLPGVSTTQRPNPDQLPSLPRALGNAGWHSAFIYGGWPDFSDFDRYWHAIGFNHTTSREDFAGERDLYQTSWGVADEHLFHRLDQEMNRRSKEHEHVFLATLTLSHHRPFDYPAGRVPWPPEERRSAYAMAYADWALGQFMAKAKTRPWYQDTLFVIAADHGARFEGNAPIPVNSYRVPLLLHGPAWFEARVATNLGSLVEVPPTLLTLLGIEDRERFPGTSLLSEDGALVPVEHDYDLGLIDETGVTILRRGGAPERWDWRDSERRLLIPGTVAPFEAAQIRARFRTAHERYYGAAASNPLP